MNLSKSASLPALVWTYIGGQRWWLPVSSFFGHRHPTPHSTARSHTLDQWWSSYLVTPCKPHDLVWDGARNGSVISVTSLHQYAQSSRGKTIEPKTWEVALGASMQQNNPISLSTKVPAPQMVLSTRYGWKPNVDWNPTVHRGGSMDIRYQFAQVDDWYFVIAPTISGCMRECMETCLCKCPSEHQRALNDKWSSHLASPHYTTIHHQNRSI